jgi:hypothetical protein
MSINPFLFNKTIKNIQPTKEDIKNQEQKLAKLKDNFKIDTYATYGFNYGLEFTGELKENKSSSSSSSSVASNISTNKFRIKSGNKATIQGVKFHHVVPFQKQYLETHLVKS